MDTVFELPERTCIGGTETALTLRYCITDFKKNLKYIKNTEKKKFGMHLAQLRICLFYYPIFYDTFIIG